MGGIVNIFKRPGDLFNKPLQTIGGIVGDVAGLSGMGVKIPGLSGAQNQWLSQNAGALGAAGTLLGGGTTNDALASLLGLPGMNGLSAEQMKRFADILAPSMGGYDARMNDVLGDLGASGRAMLNQGQSAFDAARGSLQNALTNAPGTQGIDQARQEYRDFLRTGAPSFGGVQDAIAKFGQFLGQGAPSLAGVDQARAALQQAISGGMGPLQGVMSAFPGLVSQYAQTAGVADPFTGQGGLGMYGMTPEQRQFLNQQVLDPAARQERAAVERIDADMMRRGVIGSAASAAMKEMARGEADRAKNEGRINFLETQVRQPRMAAQQNIAGMLQGAGAQQMGQFGQRLGALQGDVGNAMGQAGLGQDAWRALLAGHGQNVGNALNAGQLDLSRFGTLLGGFGQNFGNAVQQGGMEQDIWRALLQGFGNLANLGMGQSQLGAGLMGDAARGFGDLARLNLGRSSEGLTSAGSLFGLQAGGAFGPRFPSFGTPGINPNPRAGEGIVRTQPFQTQSALDNRPSVSQRMGIQPAFGSLFGQGGKNPFGALNFNMPGSLLNGRMPSLLNGRMQTAWGVPQDMGQGVPMWRWA